MDTNLHGELLIYMNMNIKPNFSALQRKYGVNRHTISKYWKQGGRQTVQRKKKKSRLDPYQEEIIKLLQKPGVNNRGAYEYMIDKYSVEELGTYNNFRSYTYRNGIKAKKKEKPHVRFETKPGEQLQVDWKENLQLQTKQGEVIQFHLMSSTLGHSRMHLFVYTKSKTTEDFLRCLIDIFQQLGGVPRHVLTDNMTAVVSITNGHKRKHPKIKSFENDTGVQIKLCKTRSPQTKGKTESANRFASWLQAYDGEIESEKELIELIEQLNYKINNTINQTTNLPPISLFESEKEALNPLPNKVMMESYIEGGSTQNVPSTLLITYQGNGYSVPSRYINKRIRIVPIGTKIYLYHQYTLITVHDIQHKKFNYHMDHYQEALRNSIHNKDIDIESVARENLELLDQIGGNQHGNTI
ncbi:IS21 family transposase [Breznakia pachnodae]|uniref:Transposase n=1 Tax=Breznakia pachnodae TaxID=265178 RepID=A0ABU0E4X8_9FIRM|nr:IS21 family transposase [Breznakia pachnodae]MDQ0361871.1 transposase [Breznakia pachnodae]